MKNVRRLTQDSCGYHFMLWKHLKGTNWLRQKGIDIQKM